MKCEYCGAQENDLTGERKHSIDCPFVTPATYTPETFTRFGQEQAARTGTQEPIGRALTQAESDAINPPKPARPPMRLMQFSGHVELTPEGEPMRVTVLINGAHVGGVEPIALDDDLSIGDAVDLALARAGRHVLSVDVS